MDIKATITDALAGFFPERANNTQPGAGSNANPAPSLSRQESDNQPPAISPEQAALLSACASGGIQTAGDVTGLLARAKDGDDFRTDAHQKLTKAAVRLFEAGPGEAKAASPAFANLSAKEKLGIAADWDAEADRKFGISETTPATRQAKPGANAQGVNAESNNGSGKLWDRLTPEQQASGVKQWGCTTEAKKEAFAKNLLGQEAE